MMVQGRKFIALMIVLPAALAGWYLMARGGRTNPNAVVVSQDITAAERASEGGGAGADAGPSFDIARIDIGGQAVISGHAAPGSKVTVLAGGARNGDATTNDRGEWVAMLNQALAGGTQDIGAVSAGQDQAERHSEQHVIAVMQHGDTPPLVLLERPGRASRILQRPDEGSSPLGIDVVDYSPDGKVTVSGHAAPKASVRLYLDNMPSGLAIADARGEWSFAPAGLATGAYTLRIDQLDAKGGVSARVELPFERLDGAAAANTLLGKANLASRFENSEWRIARRLAGTAVQYAVVYGANQARSRDPNLVYPGQIFEQGEASVE
jgi:hypothetical protein